MSFYLTVVGPYYTTQFVTVFSPSTLVAAEIRVALCCLVKGLTVGRERRNACLVVPLGYAAETGRTATANCSCSWLVQLRSECC